jgi:hypothetical protein
MQLNTAIQDPIDRTASFDADQPMLSAVELSMIEGGEPVLNFF